MPKIGERTIVRKLMAILDVARRANATNVGDLAIAIEKTKRAEFSFFRPLEAGGRRLGYSRSPAISRKIRFAIALGVLDDQCQPQVEARAVATETKAVRLFAERTKDFLASAGIDVTQIVSRSAELLREDPIRLPTSNELFVTLRPSISYVMFRSCLSILLFEPDGSLGATARRIYIARTPEHQTPGEIGD